MCGTVAYLGQKNGVPVVLEGLRKLEYRGYDSAGIAILNDHKIDIHRSVGKLKGLRIAVASGSPFPLGTNDAHTIGSNACIRRPQDPGQCHLAHR